MRRVQVACRYILVAAVLVLALTFFTLNFVISDYGRGKVGLGIFDISSTSMLDANEEIDALIVPKPERTNIFFLKAHKCASSTLQNILMRFGLERGLTFVLPSVANYIGHPALFRADMIGKDLTTLDGKYNIFAHHSRYNSKQVQSVMYDDAAYITILRHPAEVYESIFSYYKFHRVFNVSFEDVLKSPQKVLKINKRYMKKIGFNQMSFDLGLLEDDFNSNKKVEEFIRKIDTEFDLVMMSEWMEASLVLLADLMNWPLENVVSLKLNSRTSDSIYIMTKTEKQRVVNLNSVDYMLYTHFLNKFRKRIKEYGEERMRNDIVKLLSLNSKLQFQCVESLNTKGFANTQAYKLRDESDRLCFYAAWGELAFTDELRKQQKRNIQVLNKMDMLLNNYNDIT